MECKTNFNKPNSGETANLMLSTARTPAAMAIVNTIAQKENRTCPQVAESLIISAGRSRARRIAAANAFKKLLSRLCGKRKVQLSKNT